MKVLISAEELDTLIKEHVESLGLTQEITSIELVNDPAEVIVSIGDTLQEELKEKEQAKPKKRKRHTKAEIEADKQAAKEAKELEESEELAEVEVNEDTEVVDEVDNTEDKPKRKSLFIK